MTDDRPSGPSSGLEVRALSGTQLDSAAPELAEILADCVAGGASVSFMWPFSPADAARWWRGPIEAARRGEVVLLGAFLDGRLVGSVQLGLDLPPNQPHRGDVRKLIVHRGARSRGIGEALMSALEEEARRAGRTLLVLDTAGLEAERLYRRLGWHEVGTIPGYALWPDGRPCDTTLFWKEL